jgi:hypothetical protein
MIRNFASEILSERDRESNVMIFIFLEALAHKQEVMYVVRVSIEVRC